MMMWVAVGAILLAQQPQEDPVEQRVQRYKEQLTLTEEQVGKVREIVKKQLDDLRGILNDEQKTRLDQANRGGTRGNSNQGGGFNFRGGWLPSTSDLKTSVGLTDDQVAKVDEIRDAVRQEMRNFFQNRGRGGGQDLAAQWNAFQEKSKEETTKKILALLTDEQKPKFEEAVKAFAASQPTPSPDGGRTRGGSSLDERVTRMMENLKIEDAKEADAVKGLVRKVMEIMERLDAAQRESRNKIDEAMRNKDLSDDAVGDKITEILKIHRDLEKELAGARKELTEVVTNRQELELLRRGVLR